MLVHSPGWERHLRTFAGSELASIGNPACLLLATPVLAACAMDGLEADADGGHSADDGVYDDDGEEIPGTIARCDAESAADAAPASGGKSPSGSRPSAAVRGPAHGPPGAVALYVTNIERGATEEDIAAPFAVLGRVQRCAGRARQAAGDRGGGRGDR